MNELIKLIAPKDFKLLVWILVFGAGAWYNLKTEQVQTKDKLEFLQYQINELKSKQLVAILPKELKIEDKEN
jgi:hypothetical protein